MFTTLVGTNPSELTSPTAVVGILTALAVMMGFIGVGCIARWGSTRTVIGALSSGYVNSSNLGIPISLYVLGSTVYVIPIMIFQLAVVAPIALTTLDLKSSQPNQRWWTYATMPLRNPVTCTALAGTAVMLSGLYIPELVLSPLELLAQATVPLMLLIFGMSLLGSLRGESVRHLPSIATAAAFKSFLQPGLAILFGHFLFGLTGAALFAVVVCAMLPTGQNVFIYARRYGAGESARDVVTLTTVLAVPSVLVASLLLS
jgi:malonate transporter